jgi:hypothetical protein
MGQSIEKLKELEFLKQLIGEWAVGIALKLLRAPLFLGVVR